MKFKDIKINTVYIVGLAPRRVVFRTGHYIVAETEGHLYPTVYNLGIDFKNWEEVKPKVKVFVAISDRGMSMSHTNKFTLESLIKDQINKYGPITEVEVQS